MRLIKLNYFLIIVAIFSSFFIFSNIASADFNHGLVAYYQFTGNAFDSSDYDNHGTVYGATLTTDKFSNNNSAYEFDKDDDYIEVPHSSSLNFGTGDFTVSFWVNIDASDDWMVILDKRTQTPAWLGYSVFIQYQKPRLQLISGSADYFTCSQTLTANEWAHVVIVVDRNSVSGGKFFINGSLKNTFDASSSNFDLNNSEELTIGKYFLNNYYSYGGKLNNIRLYNRSLNTSEVEDLYDYENTQNLEIKDITQITDLNSNNYEETVNLFRDSSGSIVKIVDSNTGSTISSFSAFDSTWTSIGLSVVNTNNIAVSAFKYSPNEAVIRIFNTYGTQIGNDIDLTN